MNVSDDMKQVSLAFDGLAPKPAVVERPRSRMSAVEECGEPERDAVDHLAQHLVWVENSEMHVIRHEAPGQERDTSFVESVLEQSQEALEIVRL